MNKMATYSDDSASEGESCRPALDYLYDMLSEMATLATGLDDGLAAELRNIVEERDRQQPN